MNADAFYAMLKALPEDYGSLVFPRRDIELHVMLTACGCQRVSGPGYDWHGLKRGAAEFAVFQYTLRGEGLLTYEGRDRRLPAGQGMLVRIPHDHRYRVHPETGFWEFAYVCLAGYEAIRLLGRQIRERGPVIAVGDGSRIPGCVTEILNARGEAGADSPFRASAQAYALVMALADESLRVRPAGERGGGAVRRAIAHCRSHLPEPLSVDDLASLTGYSRYHFIRRFKEETGMSPGYYVTWLRLRRSVALLRDSRLSIKEIADRCGFRDANYFGKVFRKHLGASPGEYRRSGL